MVKLIIAGSRSLTDPIPIIEFLSKYMPPHNLEVVCGMAKGPDLIGKSWAESCRFPVKEFPANWDKHGRAAGFFRNRDMAIYADELIAFWDGKSNGTRNMIDEMLKRGKPFQVILIR